MSSAESVLTSSDPANALESAILCEEKKDTFFSSAGTIFDGFFSVET